MLLLIFISLVTQLHSQTSQEVLTWDSCVKEVVANNLDLKTARENVNAYKYKKNATWSEFLPSIEAGLDAGYTKSNQLYSASLSVTQNIFSGFQSLGKFRQAESNFVSQEITYQSVRSRTSYDLMMAYSQVVYAKDYLKLTEEIIKRQTDNFHLVKLNFEGGIENKGSYLLAKATLDEAIFDNRQAQRLLESARQQLAAVLGRKGLASEVDIDPAMPENEPEKNIDITKLAEQTPDYRSAQTQVQINKAGLTISRSNFYPSLDFNGDITQQGQKWPFPNSGWSAMLSLSFPLFNGGRDLYTTYSSSSLVSASLFTQDQTNLDIMYKLKQAYNGFVDAIEMVGVYRSYVEAAYTRAVIARKKYNNGLLSFEDWNGIETDLINKQKKAVQTTRERRVAEATWLLTQGKGVI